MLSFRLANEEDSSEIYTLRNLMEIRKFSTNTQKININTHQNWYKSIVSNYNHVICVAEYKTKIIGVARMDLITLNEAEVSIYMSPLNHRKRIGSSLLAFTTNESLIKWRKLRSIVAFLKLENQRSYKFFIKNGYQNPVKKGNLLSLRKEF